MADSETLIAAIQRAVAADRVRSAKLNDGVATVILDGSSLDSEARAALDESVRGAARALDGVDDVRIAMTATQPSRTLIAIASGKGGVGKSTLSANLAVALARKGHKVGLIDADVYGPSQVRLLGCDDKPRAEGDRLIPVRAQGLSFLSLAQLVSPGHALAWRGPMATGALARLIDADWGDCEILLVDLPPGTGDVQLSLVQKARPAGALIVSTPQDLALIDATRAVDFFAKTGVPIIGLVENMAGYACPHCGEASDPFGSGGAEAEAERLGIAFLGRLPLSASIRLQSDAGTPPAAGDGPEAQAFAILADRLIDAMETVAPAAH